MKKTNMNITNGFLNKGKICSIKNCQLQASCKTFCIKHYARFLKTGNPLLTPTGREHGKRSICKVENCEKIVEGYNLCIRHYKQLLRHGEIFNRTRIDKNEIRFKDSHWEMDLYDRQQKINAIALFDQTDKLEEIKQYKWCLVKKGKYGRYTKTDIRIDGKRKTLYLHDLLIGDKNGLQVDHRNGITLDNRKDNLRLVTQQQNLFNKARAKGYSWNKAIKKWEVYIALNHKRTRLGYFKSEDEARKVRKKAELKYYGEFTSL